ncbi:xanthine dehydrogenase family protein molybdopterin-binding subunit [Allostreptomyces psammosilenae]|uniref:Xanthine dehydrogenase YagR molybdenum-binding subunit n=1 Tax=Allostreptomyces psammosilenae TaxID=1892865 RepID=A0A853A3I4_9ACTN|nr:xanthine dehydrogenase family protein molybdopterin-binding subunit [Allostreptomyces psammosilenae]NYI05072.1 xanthine dehydrogenase YagR molybdenum-binding subunit [Allostreptomyces psammosilenae]
MDRVDGLAKVTGQARYAADHLPEGTVFLYPIGATIAHGRVAAVDATEALAIHGVVAVLSHRNAPRIEAPTPDLAVLQSPVVDHRGQFVAAVVAESPVTAREAAAAVRVRYETEPHRVELRDDAEGLYAPEKMLVGATDSLLGDVDRALREAVVGLDRTYTTPYAHNNPMEPHATVAWWTEDGELRMHDANQGSHSIAADVATAFGLRPHQVRVTSPYVGGGFGSKLYTHPHVLLTALAATAVGRPVSCALTRQQMFTSVGHRPAMIQRIRLGAEPDGRLVAISHEIVQQSSAHQEYAEHAARPTRMMYAAPHRRTTHRLAPLHLPLPTIMRAPGDCPGMFALESALDELAEACGVDPVELRIRNEPALAPETGRPFSSRHLVECLREGARRFGWAERDPTPRARRQGRWLLGTGVAAATYPATRVPATAEVTAHPDGDYTVAIDASDIGTGAWTVLTQIAADALRTDPRRIRLRIGDSALPPAPGAGGSRGTASWGTAVLEAAHELRRRLEEYGGQVPPDGLRARVASEPSAWADRFAMSGFGAHFVRARVDMDSGETRVDQMLGVFAVGRLVNAKTARSQLSGGMIMGLSMALHEGTRLDPALGLFTNADFAQYHVACNADVGQIDVVCLDEEDPYVNPLGAKGLGEIGIVGAAAAVAAAVYHATGVRVRDLPIHPERLLRG